MTEPTRIYPWPTVEELAEADGGNVNCTWDALRDFDEDLPAVIEEAAGLHDELTRATKIIELGSAIGGRKGERLEPGLYRLEVDKKGDLRLGKRALGLE